MKIKRFNIEVVGKHRKGGKAPDTQERQSEGGTSVSEGLSTGYFSILIQQEGAIQPVGGDEDGL